jgi:hypothetical protein
MNSDVFVIMDATQLGKHYEAKAPVKTKDGVLWLTVPVRRQYEQMITDAKIDWTQDWVGKILATVEHAYKKAPHFVDYHGLLVKWLQNGNRKLLDLDLLIIGELLKMLEIRTKVMFQSTLGQMKEKKGDLMMAITKAVGCDVYHCGSEAPGEIIDVERFKENGVGVKIQEWETPKYKQLWGKFEPDLSVIDALMNVGIDGTKEMLKT